MGVGRALVILAGLSVAAADGPTVQTPPPLDRYQDPLPQDVLARLGSSRFRQPPRIQGICFSPDGRTIATHNGLWVCLWETATGRALWRHHDSKSVEQMLFSPDGKTLALGSPLGKIRLWDAATGKPTAPFPPDSSAVLGRGVWGVMFSADGRTLAALQNTTVALWDIPERKVHRSFPLPLRQGTQQVAFSPDLKHVAVAGAWTNSREALQIWDIEAQAKVFGSSEPTDFGSFSADGKVFAAPKEPDLLVWRVEGWQALPSAPEGQLGLFARPNLEAVEICDRATGKVRARWHNPPTNARLTFAPQGTLAAAADGAQLRLFDLRRGEEIATPPGHTDVVGSLAFSGDGKTLAASDGTSCLWDVDSGRCARLGRGSVVAYSPDGKRFVEGDSSRMSIWDVEQNKVVERLAPGYWPSSLSWADADRHRVLCYQPGHLSVRDGPTGAVLLDLGKSQEKITAATLADDGRILAVASAADNTIQLWDVAQGSKLLTLTDAEEIAVLALSSTGLFLAAGTQTGHLEFWDIERQVRRYRRLEHGRMSGFPDAPASATQAVTALRFSPDGFTLVSGGKDGGVIVWEALTGQRLRTFAGPPGGVSALAFTRAADRLASAASDTSILLRSLSPAGWKKDGPAPTPAELARFWEDLAGQDAARADRARWHLSEARAVAVEFLGRHLKPAPAPVDPARLRELLAGLDNDRRAVREEASAELAGLGPKIEPTLRLMQAETKSAEVRVRLQLILTGLHARPWTPEELRQARAIQLLSQTPSPETRKLLQSLADGDRNALQTRLAQVALRQFPR